MEAMFYHNLPAALGDVFRAPAGTSVQQLARVAAERLEAIENDSERSLAGRTVLNFILGRVDNGQKDVVERALAVMDRFPHFPRPRAEVARRALHMLGEAG
ncbi:MAG TPA: hypothetical protein VNO81_00175 [Candidatus Nitrosotenuis sp.]|jgi:hypothetical protein|nr:hypothetical protein [Candidatus Nitrosotenuis sp.]